MLYDGTRFLCRRRYFCGRCFSGLVFSHNKAIPLLVNIRCARQSNKARHIRVNSYYVGYRRDIPKLSIRKRLSEALGHGNLLLPPSMRRRGAGSDAGHGGYLHKVSKLIPWLFEGLCPKHRSGVFEMAGGADEVALRKLLVDDLPTAGEDPVRHLLAGISMMELQAVGGSATLAGVTTGVQGRLATCGHPLALVAALD
jgi:hypothetical protein